MKTRAIRLARLCMIAALAATVLATVSAFNHSWTLWLINGVLCFICGGLALANYRLAKKL